MCRGYSSIFKRLEGNGYQIHRLGYGFVGYFTALTLAGIYSVE
jgi:hypothetical protein